MRIIFVRLICVICTVIIDQQRTKVQRCNGAAAGQIRMRNEKVTYVSARSTKRRVACKHSENECESHKLHAVKIIKLGQPCATQPQCQLIISNKRRANGGESLKGHSRRRRIATFIKNSALSHGPPTRHCKYYIVYVQTNIHVLLWQQVSAHQPQ